MFQMVFLRLLLKDLFQAGHNEFGHPEKLRICTLPQGRLVDSPEWFVWPPLRAFPAQRPPVALRQLCSYAAHRPTEVVRNLLGGCVLGDLLSRSLILHSRALRRRQFQSLALARKARPDFAKENLGEVCLV